MTKDKRLKKLHREMQGHISAFAIEEKVSASFVSRVLRGERKSNALLVKIIKYRDSVIGKIAAEENEIYNSI